MLYLRRLGLPGLRLVRREVRTRCHVGKTGDIGDRTCKVLTLQRLGRPHLDLKSGDTDGDKMTGVLARLHRSASFVPRTAVAPGTRMVLKKKQLHALSPMSPVSQAQG